MKGSCQLDHRISMLGSLNIFPQDNILKTRSAWLPLPRHRGGRWKSGEKPNFSLFFLMMMMKCENAIFIFSLFWTWSLAWSGCRTILPILEETLPGDLDPDYCDNHNTPDEHGDSDDTVWWIGQGILFCILNIFISKHLMILIVQPIGYRYI